MTSCLVIGGGLIGMLTARELRAAGAEVTLIERGEMGREASWAGGGILSPLYPWRYPEAVTALAAWSQRHYAALAEQLMQESGIDPQWTQSGLLMLDLEEKEAALAWSRAHDAGLTELAREALHACEPALRADCDAGLWMSAIAQVRNPRLVKSLRASLELRGVTLREQTRAQSIDVREGRAVAVQTNAGALAADIIVVAGGAWSAQLLAPLPPRVEIEPVRGQMILFHAAPDLLKRMVLYRGHYVIPRRDGHVLAGSTLEHVGYDKSTTEEARRELHALAVELIPALADCPIEHHWAGLRPGAPEGVPYIGEHPHARGLYVNAGHYRNGVVLGPASARLLADLALGRTPTLDPTPYRITARS